MIRSLPKDSDVTESLICLAACGLLCWFAISSSAEPSPHAEDVPLVPVGDDAYLMWERWPYHRIGVRAYMRSTYDRTGGNRDADASHFLYQEADDFNVALDVAGPGVLYFASSIISTRTSVRKSS